jgi:hypothetical protein
MLPFRTTKNKKTVSDYGKGKGRIMSQRCRFEPYKTIPTLG